MESLCAAATHASGLLSLPDLDRPPVIMTEWELDAVAAVLPAKKKRLRETFEQLAACSPGPLPVRWEELDAYVSSIQYSVTLRFRQHRDKARSALPPVAEKADKKPKAADEPMELFQEAQQQQETMLMGLGDSATAANNKTSPSHGAMEKKLSPAHPAGGAKDPVAQVDPEITCQRRRHCPPHYVPVPLVLASATTSAVEANASRDKAPQVDPVPVCKKVQSSGSRRHCPPPHYVPVPVPSPIASSALTATTGGEVDTVQQHTKMREAVSEVKKTEGKSVARRNGLKADWNPSPPGNGVTSTVVVPMQMDHPVLKMTHVPNKRPATTPHASNLSPDGTSGVVVAYVPKLEPIKDTEMQAVVEQTKEDIQDDTPMVAPAMSMSQEADKKVSPFHLSSTNWLW